MRSLTRDEAKAIRHIVSNGDDRALRTKKWKPIKSELYKLGLLRRRMADWAWIPTRRGLEF